MQGSQIVRVILTGLILLAISTSAFATFTPPVIGDWIIEVGEEVTLDGQDLTLPGGIFVYGHLILNNCTLRFTPVGGSDIAFRVPDNGRVDATDTVFTTTNGNPLYLALYDNSINTFMHCQFNPVNACITCYSTNTFTNCFLAGYPWTWLRKDSHNTFISTTFETRPVFMENSVNQATDCDFMGASSIAGWSRDNSVNTFTTCRFNGFEFHGASVNTLQNCTFFISPIDKWRGRLALYAESDTSIEVSDLAPGYQADTFIQSTTNTFRVHLTDCDVGSFSLAAHGNAIVNLSNSQLAELICADYVQTSLTNTHTDNLFVYTTDWHHLGQGGASCPYGNAPVNLTVSDFHDDVLQTVAVTSDNSTFHLQFNNSSVTSSFWHVGDNGGTVSSTNLIERASVRLALSHDDTLLTVRDSTLIGGVGSYGLDANTAQFIAENCTLTWLELDGIAPRVVLRQSRLNGSIFFWGGYWLGYPDPSPPLAPTLVLEDSTFSVGDPRVWVKSGVSNARIEGNTEIVPVWRVTEWADGATITRSFPIFVKDADRNPVAGAPVHVYDALGTLIWQDVTDISGCVQAEILFDESNYQSNYSVKAWAEGGADSALIYFLSSTPITLRPGAHPLSFTSFETERYPWVVFEKGPGWGLTWRQLGNTPNPIHEDIEPAAHTGDYLMHCDAGNFGIAGLQLDLPITPSWPAEVSLRGWIYPMTNYTYGHEASTFVGYQLADEYPTPTVGWTTALGYELLADGNGVLRLGDTSVTAPGLTADGWHMVEVLYDRVGHRLLLSLDGEQVIDHSTNPSLEMPVHALLGTCAQGTSDTIGVCFDDVELTLGTAPDTLPENIYSGISGPQTIVAGEPNTYVLWYGNGYPVLGGMPSPGTPGAETIILYLSNQANVEIVNATPTPTSYEPNGDVVWHLPQPYPGQEQYIFLEVMVPSGTPSGVPGGLVVYQNTEEYPEDLLLLHSLTPDQLKPDLWIRKEGPETAIPGEMVNYVLTAGNRGYAPAHNLVMKDWPPQELGGGERIVSTLSNMAPGETWQGVVSLLLPLTSPTNTMITNWAGVESDSEELDILNNVYAWDTFIQDLSDPNQMDVTTLPPASPKLTAGSGGIERGDVLVYTVDCENITGETAYGVYATIPLDNRLDDNTLSLPEGMSYDSFTRMLLWKIGTLPSGGTAQAVFTIQVPITARRARPIIAKATLHFPSVPMKKTTNVVLSVVNGSFTDLSWNHWALLPVELAYENGIVQGYANGTYRPTVIVTRGQMAVYVARALAEGDALVPEGPLTTTFTDIPLTHPYFKYIEYAVDQGVVQGYSDGTYHPERAVNRGQMAIYIARALVAPGGDDAVPPGPSTPTFPDILPEAQAYKQIEYIVSRGVVGGYPDGTYRAGVNVTRDQMAVYVARAFALPQ